MITMEEVTVMMVVTEVDMVEVVDMVVLVMIDTVEEDLGDMVAPVTVGVNYSTLSVVLNAKVCIINVCVCVCACVRAKCAQCVFIFF